MTRSVSVRFKGGGGGGGGGQPANPKPNKQGGGGGGGGLANPKPNKLVTMIADGLYASRCLLSEGRHVYSSTVAFPCLGYVAVCCVILTCKKAEDPPQAVRHDRLLQEAGRRQCTRAWASPQHWSVIIIMIIIIALKGAIREHLQSPHGAANCLQHVRSRGQGAIVCKSRATNRALIMCNMLSATWYEETAQLLCLTDFKFHIF